MTIKIEVEPYLKEFMHAIFGASPINFPKGHVLNFVLRHLLDRPPRDIKELNNYNNFIEIQIPYDDQKNVIYNFHLSEESKKILKKRIEREFRLTFRDDINASRLSGIKRVDAVWLFIDKYQLNPGNIDMLLKDYHRNYHLKYMHRTRKKNANKSRQLKD